MARKCYTFKVMKALEYPFDGDEILKKSKRLRRELLADHTPRLKKNIAVLGGSTTHDIVRVLELFLLHYGIEPVFYESEFARYWQDAMFPEEPLASFAPDLIYIHTTFRNITELPVMSDDAEAVRAKREAVFSHFTQMWEKLKADYACPVIQNNFEYPDTRLSGNRDAYDIRGRVRFVNDLNTMFADYAASREGFYINDICYLSAQYGLSTWSEPSYWYMYKYALAIPAVPYLAFSVANIVKSVFGKNKKTLVLDLDNTLWGGVIGDDGREGIVIGRETASGEAFTAFQEYVKSLKDIGVVLNISSKNTGENARDGLRHPDSVLREEDFVFIRANWDPKSENVRAITEDLNVLPDSVVFADDNPAEREIVTAQVPGVTAPPLGNPEHYIRALDRAAFFEVTNLSGDDMKRTEMYRENTLRKAEEARFADYHDYLLSLRMEAVIAPFDALLFERISQLTNKSNQFNLTTKRYTVDEIAQAAGDESRVTLYGRLADRFGDNGVVSLVAGRIDNDSACHIELWLMSCRVLKRDMECAMMDALAAVCEARRVKTVFGYYYPTAKNGMVEDFYALQGFECVKSGTRTADGRAETVWKLDLTKGYRKKNNVIRVITESTQKESKP